MRARRLCIISKVANYITMKRFARALVALLCVVAQTGCDSTSSDDLSEGGQPTTPSTTVSPSPPTVDSPVARPFKQLSTPGFSCDKPRSDPNGYWAWIDSDTVDLICYHGFRIAHNASSEVTCTNGKWPAVLPYCEAVKCGEYSHPNADFVYDELSQAGFITCHSGYSISGSYAGDREQMIACRSGKWSGTPRACVQDVTIATSSVILSCPARYSNGHGVWSYDRYTSTLTCNYGYRIKHYPADTEYIDTCMSGAWLNPQLECVRATCASPTVSNGLFFSPGQHGDIGTVLCDYGYELEGMPESRCDNGSYPHVARCVAKRESTSNKCKADVVVPFSHVTYDATLTSAKLQCDRGYSIEGYTALSSTLLYCRANGTWGGIQSCHPKVCNGTPTYNGTWTTATHGQRGRLTCHPGYRIRGESDAVTSKSVQCDDGRFTDELECIRIEAPRPPAFVPPLAVPPVQSIPIMRDDAWLHGTHFIDNGVCPAAPTLYRGVHSGALPIAQVLRNMMGDELAELQSWRFSKLLYERLGYAGISPTLAQWRQLKAIALHELQIETRNDVPVCAFGQRSAGQTLVVPGVDPREKYKSYGLATATEFGHSAVYASGTFKPGINIQDSVIIEIVEQVSRAAKALFVPGEYFVPIVLPAADIVGAWPGTSRAAIHGHYIKKIVHNGRLQEIIVYRQQVFVDFPFEPFRTEGVDGRIIACLSVAPCVSDAAPANDPALQQIIRSIPTHAINGVRYRFTASDHH